VESYEESHVLSVHPRSHTLSGSGKRVVLAYNQGLKREGRKGMRRFGKEVPMNKEIVTLGE